MPHAIQMDRYGPPDVLSYRLVDREPPAPGDVTIRTLFAAINHTDLHIRAGDWPIRRRPTFPYTPGVEVVGVIEDSGASAPSWQPGDVVMTMMQGLGGVRAERPGGYAEFVTVAADALARLPADVEPADMAALGLGAVTAYQGLARLGDLAGKEIAVTGAAGGVGSNAIGIAAARGATVTALVRKEADGDYVRSLGASSVVVSDADPIRPNSVDGVLDTVGGATFASSVAALRSGGALCLVGAVAGGDVRFDAWHLIRPVRLTGYSTENLGGEALCQSVQALANLLVAGAIRVPDHRVMPLAEAASAHRALEERSVRGRILLKP